MVAPCASGVGQPRPGFERAVNVTAASVEAVLTAVAGPEAAIFLAPIIAGQRYDLSSICTDGDPGDPGLTAQDLVDAANIQLDFDASVTAWSKIRTWFLHVMWPRWCECVDGTTLSPPTVAPVPQPTLNPGMPAGPTGTHCWDVTRVYPGVSGTQTYLNSMFPKTTDVTPGSYPAGEAPQLLTLPRATVISVSITSHGMTPGSLWAWDLQTLDSNGVLVAGNELFSPSLAGNVTYAASTPVDNLVAAWRLFAFNNNPFQPAASFEVHVTLDCPGGGALVVSTPCCPPDPSVDARLNYLIQLAHANIDLQGQALRGHVDGTRHAGLSGAGTVTLVDSVLAVRVEIHNGLGSLQFNPGDPNYYFSAGFITPIAAGSPLKGARLVYAAQTFPIPSFTDQIGYTLPGGQTIDIVELIPAP